MDGVKAATCPVNVAVFWLNFMYKLTQKMGPGQLQGSRLQQPVQWAPEGELLVKGHCSTVLATGHLACTQALADVSICPPPCR